MPVTNAQVKPEQDRPCRRDPWALFSLTCVTSFMLRCPQRWTNLRVPLSTVHFAPFSCTEGESSCM